MAFLAEPEAGPGDGAGSSLAFEPALSLKGIVMTFLYLLATVISLLAASQDASAQSEWVAKQGEIIPIPEDAKA